MKMPEVRVKLREVGLEPVYRNPREMRAAMAAAVASFTKLAKAANIKAE